MQEPGCHETYPVQIVIASNLVAFMIYGIGAWILYQFGLTWVIGYGVFIFCP